jgi:hypothetical protein
MSREQFPSHEKESPFAELRTSSHAEMERDLAKRLKENPYPTDHELRIGAFDEEIEPQMREALKELYAKGYFTESSGFGGIDGEEIQQIDGYFEIDPQTEEKLKALGAWVTREHMDYYHSTLTRIEFKTDEPDMQKIAEKWKEVIDVLPPIGKESYSSSAPSYEFRQKYLGDDEARRIQIETALEQNHMPDDEREPAEKWLREHLRK